MSLVRVKREDLKPLTNADRARLRKVADRAEVDFSDIPELPDAWFAKARQAAHAASQAKSQIALRLDADLIEWFRSQGPGYQSRMNAVLRTYMEAFADKSGKT